MKPFHDLQAQSTCVAFAASKWAKRKTATEFFKTQAKVYLLFLILLGRMWNVIALKKKKKKMCLWVLFSVFVYQRILQQGRTLIEGSPPKDRTKLIASWERILQIAREVTRLWMCVHAIRRLRKGRGECLSFFFFSKDKKLARSKATAHIPDDGLLGSNHAMSNSLPSTQRSLCREEQELLICTKKKNIPRKTIQFIPNEKKLPSLCWFHC